MRQIATLGLLTLLIHLPLLSQAQTLQEKIGQMIMVGVETSQEHQDSLKYDIEHRNLGGVLMFAYNLRFPSQIRSQNSRLQRLADTPLFLATDQEGGIVARLDEQNGYQRTFSAHKLGTEFNSEDSTRKQAALMAGWMNTAGLNMNLAPVVDVNVDPNSPAIGGLDRSYSSDESVVYQHASWFADEFHKQNIATSLKHFPGHGSAVSDSHEGFTDITDTWEDRELDPFRFLIEDGYSDAVMTGHLFNQNWDENYPASLSSYAVTDILRDSLGFDGVVISDELFMGAVQENYGMDEAIVQVVNSDTDILLFNTNLYNDKSLPAYIISLISEKVEAGIIDEATITASYNRIMALKNSRIPTSNEFDFQPNELPDQVEIANYPNPFNPSTTIRIALDQASQVRVQVYNSIGQQVQTLAQTRLASGIHSFTFDGRSLSSGMYLVVVSTPETRQVHKMMLIK
ncbi:glycoside hydrolase family 3 N-terminal domain-containing protein [Gracilimonas sp. BCB1]|uniref:glycoside hydrolase family 3 N-terminal domain-containing protein n=1 Tax=Gracilimonas sp. BCB1 TaxID=3152362 RepID=UPI0032D9357F